MLNKAELITLAMTVIFLAAVILLSFVQVPAEITFSSCEESSGGISRAVDGTTEVSREAGSLRIVLVDAVDLNSATAQELTRLPGIGEALAGRIVAYREENGPFARLEDLLNVPGIGEATLDGIYARMER
jgi:competence protein ComEA